MARETREGTDRRGSRRALYGRPRLKLIREGQVGSDLVQYGVVSLATRLRSPIWRRLGELAARSANKAIPSRGYRVRVSLAPRLDLDLHSTEAMARHVMMLGAYEPAELSAVIEAIRPGTTFIDVGANVGYFSLAAAYACPDADVHAVEPIPDNADRLEAHLTGSDVTNVTVHRTAAGTGTDDLWLDATSDGAFAHQVTADHQGAIPAKQTTLDLLWTSLGKPEVSAIKVDVEGAELEVLRGSSELLRRDKPVLLIEVVDQDVLRDLNVILGPLGYLPLQEKGFFPYNRVFRAS